MGNEFNDHYPAGPLAAVPCRHSAGWMVLARSFEIGGASLEGLGLALLPVDGYCSLQYVAEPWSLMHMKRNFAAGFNNQHGRFHIPFSGQRSDGHLLKRVRGDFLGCLRLRR